MTGALRMIDANSNRAREALRTIEDVARFAFNDGAIAEEAKSLRHALQSALATIPAQRLAAARDVAADVGTSLAGANEYAREDLSAIVIAAGKRLGEALRVMEEASKTLTASEDGANAANDARAGVSVARALEALRYRAYALDARAVLRASRSAPQWKLCVLLTIDLCARPWQEVVLGAIHGGADAIQVREKNLSTRALVEHAAAVCALAQPRGAAVIVNDRLDVALAVRADGVHLGADDLAISDARRIISASMCPSMCPSMCIGATTHSIDEARAAIATGADYCGVGPMYATALKPHLDARGDEALRAFVAEFPQIPHLAIGGIEPGRVEALTRAGCRGVAVSRAICAAQDPAAVARAIIDELTRAQVPS